MAYRNKKNPTRTAYPNVDVILSLLTPLWHLDCLRSQVRKISQLLIKGRCNPTNNDGMQNGSSEVHIACTFFCTFGTDLYARSVLISKISASELSRKSIRSALLVGNLRMPGKGTRTMATTRPWSPRPLRTQKPPRPKICSSSSFLPLQFLRRSFLLLLLCVLLFCGVVTPPPNQTSKRVRRKKLAKKGLAERLYRRMWEKK